MALKFRNLLVEPSDPVDVWGFEGLLAAVERGDVRDWRRIVRAVNLQPRGKVARELREVTAAVESPAMSVLFGKVLESALARSEARERAAVAADLQASLAASGLTRSEFAMELGTSQSRLSTYLSGKVVPSAALLVRARNVVGSHSDRVPKAPVMNDGGLIARG